MVRPRRPRRGLVWVWFVVYRYRELEEEELKHDLNELCIYVHKLFDYCEGAWRATDLVVLTL